ncbi:MAG TPA: phage tail sheath C-terminal domain-containing protein [Allosphingosinicella sp.]|nr:phage tail sheath C-terminal domain-containing protein [Allosphingosinicella sp.]
MPVRPTYPGVYVEEIPSGVRPVAAVATSTAAFIGTFRKGLLNEAVQLLSMADFEREYGGLDRNSEASYAVQQFFLNGGSEAWVVRVANDGSANGAAASVAEFTLNSVIGGSFGVVHAIAGRRIRGEAAENPGSWGRSLRLEVDHNSSNPEGTFNLVVKEVRVEGTKTIVVQSETFNGLTMEPNRPNNALEVVNQGSRLIQLDRAPPLPANLGSPAERPAPTGTISGPLAPPGFPIPTTNLDVSLSFGGAAPVAPTFPVTLRVLESNTFAQWAQNFQTALRDAGASTAVDPQFRPYLSGATVSIIGDDLTPTNPRRFVIKAGFGAQPYDPSAELRFASGDSALFGLAVPDSVGPQQFVPMSGADGDVIDAGGNYIVPASVFEGNPAAKTGIHALEDVDIFNVLAIPDAPRLGANDLFSIYTEATAYVERRRAMLLIDIPDNINQIDQMQTWMADNDGLRHPNAAVYFPRTYIPDPLNLNRLRGHAASGTIAGLWARTDAQRGVWKAPAGTDARLRGVDSLTRLMTDLENGVLNPLGINCLRNFPIYSNICWGARTLEGADALASDWKYVPVRRTTLFIEESLYRGTKWVVFEPNDEPLWAQIRLNVGSFMQDLFRKGAFQGSTPRDAYFVRCDGTTTTQTDIDNGIVNIEVGFAPLKPAEFVILKISQIARQAGA